MRGRSKLLKQFIVLGVLTVPWALSSSIVVANEQALAVAETESEGLAKPEAIQSLQYKTSLDVGGQLVQQDTTVLVSQNPHQTAQIIEAIKEVTQNSAPTVLVAFPAGNAQALAQVDSIAESLSPQAEVRRAPLSDALRYIFITHYRVTFSLIRFSGNGISSAVQIMATSHISPEGAVSTGLLLGTMSGLLQYNKKAYYERWLGRASVSRALKAVGKTRSVMDAGEWFSKYFLTQTIFVGAAALSLHYFGQDVGFLAALLPAATAVTFSQGTLDGAITRNVRVERLRQEHSHESIELLSHFGHTGASLVSTLSSLAKLHQLPLSNFGFIGMAATGVGLYLRSWYYQSRCHALESI